MTVYARVLPAACSSSGGGASVDAGKPDAPREDAGVARAVDYCESIVDFFCPFYLRCGRIAESDLASCRQTFLETCNAVYEPRYVALEAAERAEENGVSCEVLDLRTIVPLDTEAVIETAKKTGRVIVLYEAPRTGGFGAEIAATIAERAIEYLEAPIARVAGFDTPFPYTLEHVYLPDAGRVPA